MCGILFPPVWLIKIHPKFGVRNGFTNFNHYWIMPFHRNFTYYIDKRKWKYIFLLATLELSRTSK